MAWIGLPEGPSPPHLVCQPDLIEKACRKSCLLGNYTWLVLGDKHFSAVAPALWNLFPQK